MYFRLLFKYDLLNILNQITRSNNITLAVDSV